MATYTWRVTNDAEDIIAWVDKDGYPMLRQPHHPQQALVDGKGTWASTSEAEVWATTLVEQMIADDEARATSDVIAAEKAAADAVKIDEIHAMLTALSQK